MPAFDFDEEIDRRVVPALKHHRRVLGADGSRLFAAGVADMDFRAAPCITEAIARRAAHGVFGYEAVPDGLMPSLTGWLAARHGWQVAPEHILRAPNVLNALAMTLNLFTRPGEGVIVQPPVFFDFADIIAENGRCVVENPLILRDGRYEMDLDGLARVAADPGTRMIFLCNPYNPVGRVWRRDDLARLGRHPRRRLRSTGRGLCPPQHRLPAGAPRSRARRAERRPGGEPARLSQLGRRGRATAQFESSFIQWDRGLAGRFTGWKRFFVRRASVSIIVAKSGREWGVA